MDRTRMVFSKWGGRPHWEYDAVRLGADRHGTWLGLPVGTAIARPGAAFETREPQVVLVPEDDFVATFYAPGGPCAVYVDISTVPVWDGCTVVVVDLDLDVVKGWSGRVWVDDEDEFADHRARYRYPDAVVLAATSACDRVRLALEAGAPPYDGSVSAHWLGVLQGRPVAP